MTSVRKTLHPLQQAAGDKENLVGPGRMLHTADKDTMKGSLRELNENDKVSDAQAKLNKRKKVGSKSTQASGTKQSSTVTAEDLTSAAPSETYWQTLAEQRRLALEDALAENKELHKKIARLQEENKICKEMLQETESLVDVLKDMIGHDDTADESNIIDDSYEV